MLKEVFNLYRNGDAIPYIILAFMCVGYIIIFEKFMLFQFIYKINFEKFNAQLKKMLLANDMDRARSFSQAVSKTGVPMLMVCAIDSYENDPMAVRATVSEEALQFFPRLRRRLVQLPNFAATCVILGVIASVSGLWNSFEMMDGLELGIKSFSFAKGLTLALLPLSIALIAALSLMLPFGILEAMAWRLESEMEHSLCVVLNILSPDKIPVAMPSHSNENHSSQENKGESFPRSEEIQAPYSASIKEEHENSGANNAQKIPDEEEII